jgi:hypothetical protein
MINPNIKNAFISTGKSAKQVAIRTAKQFGQEPSELLKVARSQVAGSSVEAVSAPSAVAEIMTGGGSVKQPTTEEEAKIHSLAKKRMRELEEEIKRMRQVREGSQAEWEKSQQQAFGTDEHKEGEKKQPLVQPTSIRKRGMAGQTKQKQGTKEMAKQVSG